MNEPSMKPDFANQIGVPGQIGVPQQPIENLGYDIPSGLGVPGQQNDHVFGPSDEPPEFSRWRQINWVSTGAFLFALFMFLFPWSSLSVNSDSLADWDATAVGNDKKSKKTENSPKSEIASESSQSEEREFLRQSGIQTALGSYSLSHDAEEIKKDVGGDIPGMTTDEFPGLSIFVILGIGCLVVGLGMVLTNHASANSMGLAASGFIALQIYLGVPMETRLAKALDEKASMQYVLEERISSYTQILHKTFTVSKNVPIYVVVVCGIIPSFTGLGRLFVRRKPAAIVDSTGVIGGGGV